MKNLKKKYSIKVPKNIKVVYCDKKNLITFIGPLSTKSLNLKVKLLLISSLNSILVTCLPIDSKSTTDLKNSKKIQGTTIAAIRQILVEVTYVLSCKLKFVGVGDTWQSISIFAFGTRFQFSESKLALWGPK